MEIDYNKSLIKSNYVVNVSGWGVTDWMSWGGGGGVYKEAASN